MGCGKSKNGDKEMICTPMNSIICYLETALWQTFSLIVCFVVLIDVWNTNAGLLLALGLFGILVNFAFFLWVVLYEGSKVYKFASIISILDSKTFCQEATRKLQWGSDQSHFFNNTMAYLVFLVFFGSWLGINLGLVAYQPLPLVPTSLQITNMVIHKFFAFYLIGLAGLSWRLLFNNTKYFLYAIMNYLRRKDLGTLTTSK